MITKAARAADSFSEGDRARNARLPRARRRKMADRAIHFIRFICSERETVLPNGPRPLFPHEIQFSYELRAVKMELARGRIAKRYARRRAHLISGAKRSLTLPVIAGSRARARTDVTRVCFVFSMNGKRAGGTGHVGSNDD